MIYAIYVFYKCLSVCGERNRDKTPVAQMVECLTSSGQEIKWL